MDKFRTPLTLLVLLLVLFGGAVYGWSAVVAEVFGLDLTSAWFDRLADAALPLRPPTPA